jgi:hypothetical protein
MLVAVRVISELSKYPGAEDDAEPRQAADDLGVRVLLKMAVELDLELDDLSVHLRHHADHRLDRGPEGAGEHRGRVELL